MTGGLKLVRLGPRVGLRGLEADRNTLLDEVPNNTPSALRPWAK
jgi:hypothetical protein